MPVMPKNLVRVALIAGLAAAASPAPGNGLVTKPAVVASALPAAAQEAAAIVDAFHAALQHGDVRAASALLADDVLIYESGEVERSKAAYAGHHLGADIEFERAVKSTVTARAGNASGNMAWIASEGRTTGNFKGRAIDSMTTETMVLKQVGPGWRIVQIHWSSAKVR